MSAAQPETIAEEVFIGGGEMGALMRSVDWSQTALGAVQSWSQSLKTAVRIMLTSRQAMFVWWGEELINLYNDAYRTILGGKHPEALGQPASQVWREIWEQVGPRAESAIRNNEGTYDEALLLIMERNGYPEETYYTFSYSPVPDIEGRTGGIICANTDDTQRIIGERQLALLKELASRTADARTFEAACTLSATCLATNPYDLPFALIYLVEPDEECAVLAGTAAIEPGHPIALPKLALDDPVWRFAEVLQTQQPYLIPNLDGHFNSLPTGAWQDSPHQLAVLPIASSGKSGKAGILVTGLNPFRLFDDNYQRFLNLVSAQIAASIANAQAYEEERKRAEALAELDRAKTTFFSNISHEFRTPLTLMISPLEEMLAADGAISDEQRQQLELVHRNSLRLLKLVNALLDFSRIEAGRVQAVYEPTDLSALTAELASVFRSAIEQAGLQLLVTCEVLTAPVYVDREMWEKIVLNLLSNAFKFTFSGEIAVTLRQKPSEVELTVRDTGIGVPAAELSRLFERFHRVEGARGRTQEGSGIGLALVQELVRLHQGEIQVESIEGEGTTFILTIPTGTDHLPVERLQSRPVASAREAAEIQAAQTSSGTAPGAAPYVEEVLRWLPEEEQTGEWEEVIPAAIPYSHAATSAAMPAAARILLADDNADMREYVKRLLLNQGYDVQAATDGIAALAAIQQQLPDLVLTDVMMPGLDGFGLLRELRSAPTTRDIPIILLSARAGEEARVEGLEAGADDYLIKPFAARELLARVEASLKLASLRRETTQREQTLRLEAEAIQQRVETILSSISDGFLVLDRSWCYTYSNDRNCEIIGMSRSEVLGKNIWELFPDMMGTEVYVNFQRALAEQTAIRFEYFYSTWNRWFEYRVYPSPSGLTVFVAEINDRKQIETERKQAEDILRQQREQLQLFVQHVPAEVAMFDRQMRYLYVSDRWLISYGLSEQNVIGQSHYDVFPDMPQYWKDIHQRCLAGAVEECSEAPFFHPGGFDWIRWEIRPWYTNRNEIGGIIIFSEVITERKQAEEALRQSEEQFRNMADNAPFMVWVTDPTGYCTYLSQSWYDFTGQTEESGLGSGWLSITHPDDRKEAERTFLTASQRREAFRLEYRLRRKDGKYIWAIGAASPWFGVDGQFRGYVGSVVDISDRKRAEEALRYANERFEYATAAVDCLIYDWDIEQDHVERTDGLTRILGYPLEETEPTASWWCERLHPEDLQRVRAEAAAVLATCDRYTTEYRVLNRDKQYIYVVDHGIVVSRDAEGRPTRIIGSTVDINDRKQAEAEREHLLARERAAREDAETANRVKDEFLAVLSHELRSPLNPILGWSRLLQTHQFDQQGTKQALQTIERNAKLQTQLIEDLLDVSRILQGKMALNVCPVNLVTVVESALETVRLAAEAKRIQIRTAVSFDNAHINGDSARLQQIVWNLLSNAVKFTPDAGQVEVCLERIGTYAQIQVRDTGKGINPDFLPYVFDYFRQEDGRTTRKFGGLGLGLAIVRHLTELHGGTVHVESLGEGQGATFVVRLPLTAKAVESDEKQLASAQSVDLSQLKILVVDDDEDMRDLMQVILEQQGAEVAAVASAAEVLMVFDRQPPDIFISDIGMPEIDGYMLIQQIRSRSPEQGGLVPAIALTAYAAEYDQQQALKAGFQKHLAKPIEPEELVRVIGNLVRKL
ncbi:PAS domain S-box protein [Phormidium tenue FACHB-886]|nr:PAS domain S-box protein [Phormidium tenue FACHB-886]